MSAPLILAKGDSAYLNSTCVECHEDIPGDVDLYMVEGTQPEQHVCLKCTGELAGAAMVARHA